MVYLITKNLNSRRICNYKFYLNHACSSITTLFYLEAVAFFFRVVKTRDSVVKGWITRLTIFVLCRMKSTMLRSKTSTDNVEDLQIFLQYVKSSLTCVLVDNQTLESVRQAIDELISEIDNVFKGSYSPMNFFFFFSSTGGKPAELMSLLVSAVCLLSIRLFLVYVMQSAIVFRFL